MTADADVLRHAGVAQDSIERLLSILRASGIPTTLADVPSSLVVETGSGIARRDADAHRGAFAHVGRRPAASFDISRGGLSHDDANGPLGLRQPKALTAIELAILPGQARRFYYAPGPIRRNGRTLYP